MAFINPQNIGIVIEKKFPSTSLAVLLQFFPEGIAFIIGSYTREPKPEVNILKTEYDVWFAKGLYNNGKQAFTEVINRRAGIKPSWIVFRIENNQFQAEFCLQCGNYKSPELEPLFFTPTIRCLC